jgi:hypothetical protein
MYARRPYRNVCRILPVGLLLVLAANSLLADSFTITGTADTSTIPGISAGEHWNGTLTTNGICSVCTPANGGLLSLSIDMYGDIFSASDVNTYPASPTFDRTTDSLALTVTAGTNSDNIFIFPNGTFEIDRAEVGGVNGTYGISGGSSVPEPAGIVLLGTILAMTFVTLRKKKAIGS